ncbi:MAG: MFS transporter [Francisellaceae bacterium]
MIQAKNRWLIISIVFIEWVEYSLYLYLGAILAAAFFGNDSTQSFVFIYLIFAISYLSRPFGGFIFGAFSDLIGRKKPLLISGLIMALSTLLISVIPDFDAIGFAAPLLLLLLRFLQGVAAAGEFNNSAILLMEYSARKRTLAGSWTGFASSAGMFIGSLIALICMRYFSSQSWRVAYAVVGVLSLFIFFMRRRILESPKYLAHQATEKSSPRLSTLFSEIINTAKSATLIIIVVSAFMSVYIYTCMIYFIRFFSEYSPLKDLNPLTIVSITQALVTLIIPMMASLAEITDYKKLFQACILLIAIMAPMLFLSSQYGSKAGLIAAIILYIIANGGISAIIFRYMFELVPTPIRCLSTSFSWSLSAAVFGSTAPILSSFFVAEGFLDFPWLYVTGLSILCFLVVTFSTLTNKIVDS